MVLFRKKKQGLTLIELIAVIAIVAVTVSFAMPGYVKARKKSVDREAQTHLKFIYEAEKAYRMRAGTRDFVACIDNIDCSSKLNLKLPVSTASGGHWDYSVLDVNYITFTAQAVGTKGTGNWKIDVSRNITKL